MMLDDTLPPAPPGKSGWPWIANLSAATPSNEGGLPKISIVTPSYMQGRYLEETIRSVLLQGYPNLEYIVIDGGSTDESLEIIRKYEPWLAFWVSEKDRGQTEAINKGLSRCTGEIFAYLNSDDVFCEGALKRMAHEFAMHPERSWVSGAVVFCLSLGEATETLVPSPFTLAECLGRRPKVGINQPSTFWRRSLFEKTGPFDESLDSVMDSEFYARSMMNGFESHLIDQPIAYYRLHPSSKTVSQAHISLNESWKVFRKYRSRLSDHEAGETERWLNVFEANIFIQTVYGFLLANRRVDALSYTLQRIGTIPPLLGWKLYLGALFRCAITGCPPRWFQTPY